MSAVALVLQLMALTMAWVSVVETCKRAVGNLASVVLGRRFFGEPITLVKIVAVSAMALGVALIL